MEDFFISFSKFIVYFSVAISAFCLIVYKKLTPTLKIFAIYLISSGAIDIISLHYGDRYKNNLPFLHLFTLMEMAFLGTFFISVFNSFNTRLKVLYTITPFLLAIVCNSLFLQSLNVYNSYSATLVSIVLIGFSIYTFYLILEENERKDLEHIKLCTIGVFIYHMTSIIILSSANLTLHFSAESQLIIWMIRAFILFITKALFFFVIWSASRQAKVQL